VRAAGVIDVGVVSLASYLVGAIPFSYLAGRVFGGIDLRRHGSGNLGASNAFRLLGGRVAVGVLVADVAKGFVPVLAAPSLAPAGAVADHWLAFAAAFFAVVGHMFSVFVGFSGGKGVATTAGAFLALSPAAILVTAVIFAVVFAAKRIVSLSSITCAVLLPVVVFVLDRTGVSPSHWSVQAVSIFIAVVILIRHRENIRRLARGEEHVLQRTKR
jgi:glycerol-3-phosphate acyltransferase PlsY